MAPELHKIILFSTVRGAGMGRGNWGPGGLQFKIFDNQIYSTILPYVKDALFKCLRYIIPPAPISMSSG